MASQNKFDVMISYAHKSGKECMEKILKLLEDNGLTVWVDRREVVSRMDDDIAKGITSSHVLVALISKAYYDSPYCQDELAYAKNRKKNIIPVKVEDYTPPESSGIAMTFNTRFHPKIYGDFDETEKLMKVIKKYLDNLKNAGPENQSSSSGSSQHREDEEQVPCFICRDEDADGLIERIQNLNNQYPGIPNEQPAYNALRSRVPCPPEAPRNEPTAGEQNQSVENDVNKIQPVGVQEVNEEPSQIERQRTIVQVNHDQCTHLLKDASYNDMDDLSDVLDAGAILDVMKTLISIKEFEHIWSSCHGGSDPPMNLLFRLAAQNCKLSDLKRFATSDKGGRFRDLINLIDAHTRVDRCCMEKRLDELDFRLLSSIAESIRVKPYPQKRPLWKRLASYAGLDEASITALDVPATGERKGLTMGFLERISHTNPRETVAWLASGLVANGLIAILEDDNIEIFKECKHHCINIV